MILLKVELFIVYEKSEIHNNRIWIIFSFNLITSYLRILLLWQQNSVKLRKRNTRRKVQRGVVHILATFNNTLVTISDRSGLVIASSSAGACGFRGARKGTPFAAQTASEEAVRKALDYGLKYVDVMVKRTWSWS